MQLRLGVAAIALLLMPLVAQAKDITVAFRHTVEPDADLKAFIDKLRSLDAAPKKLDIKAIDALFAPRVKAFYRSLDPFQPWRKIDDITSHYLHAAANVMVEQGEVPEGSPIPDYSADAFKAILRQVSEGATFGTLKEMPGAICAPAAYAVDRKAALAFAKKFELDAYSLRFFAQPVALYKGQNIKGELVGMVPPYTLMMFDYDPKAREGWGRYQTSDGKKGYMTDREDTLGLAQQHVCFGKVKGQYRITALFGYGL